MHVSRIPNLVRAAVLATIVALTAAAFTVAPAEAAPFPPTITKLATGDDYVKSRCTFHAFRASYPSGVVRGNLRVQNGPNGFFAGTNIAHVDTTCILRDGANTIELDTVNAAADRAYASKTKRVNVPLYPSYKVCVLTAYTLRNGDTTVLPIACSS